jgi:hypothetical protein
MAGSFHFCDIDDLENRKRKPEIGSAKRGRNAT